MFDIALMIMIPFTLEMNDDRRNPVHVLFPLVGDTPG